MHLAAEKSRESAARVTCRVFSALGWWRRRLRLSGLLVRHALSEFQLRPRFYAVFFEARVRRRRLRALRRAPGFIFPSRATLPEIHFPRARSRPSYPAFTFSHCGGRDEICDVPASFLRGKCHDRAINAALSR